MPNGWLFSGFNSVAMLLSAEPATSGMMDELNVSLSQGFQMLVLATVSDVKLSTSVYDQMMVIPDDVSVLAEATGLDQA